MNLIKVTKIFFRLKRQEIGHWLWDKWDDITIWWKYEVMGGDRSKDFWICLASVILLIAGMFGGLYGLGRLALYIFGQSGYIDPVNTMAIGCACVAIIVATGAIILLLYRFFRWLVSNWMLAVKLAREEK